MNKWYAEGNVIELSDYDYYNQWLGTIISTNYLGGLLGGYFDKHEKNGNILEKHSESLRENINLVKDKTFRNLLNDFEVMFTEIISLDKEAINYETSVLHLSAHMFFEKTEVKQKWQSIINDFAFKSGTNKKAMKINTTLNKRREVESKH